MPELDIECPRCGNTEAEEIEDLEEGTLEVECSVCHVVLEATYTVSVDVDAETPPVEFECPECGCSLSIEEVSGESGDEEIECEGCEAQLTVQWSDWGVGDIEATS